MRESVRERGGESVRESFSEREYEGKKGHIEDYVEFKSFFIDFDFKSRGETIIITERSRSKDYQIRIGLGCAAWLIEELRKARGAGDQQVCKMFRGNNYNFWLENYKNGNGSFLKLSQCGNNGYVQSIILLKGKKEEGCQKLEENLKMFMFGNNKGTTLENVGSHKLKGQFSFDNTKDSCRSMKDRETETVDSTQTSSVQKVEEFKDTWGCLVVCERQTIF